ncbi:MAG TPA: glycosyltransferase family 4 protein [Vicinamibacterales bacterium]|nr:glycosyltransferase family 4 protein [Vicinamibacterales bacterium]
MRIAQISPLYESVPPLVYGGTERVVSYLTEELVRLGHDVTLFASGDSRTAARLVPVVERSLRLDTDSVDSLAHHILMIERVRQMVHDFDIVHFHIDYLHFPVSRLMGLTQLTTLHGRLNLKDLVPLYDEFTDMPVVSISDSQREPLPQAHWLGTVYHGLPPDLFSPDPHARGDYLLFVGRISPEKRVDRAVEIARRVGLPLRVAAKISDVDRAYFDREIAPLFEEPFVEFLDEVNDHEKGPLMAGAHALLFPIDWPEPFGLVMIEAMACGTPTIAWDAGSVSEVITDNVSGFIVNSLDDAVSATERAATLPRDRIRREFDERFTVNRMAKAYLDIYGALLGRPADTVAAGTGRND